LYASVASYEDILVSVISEVARNYINYQMANERIRYAKRNVAIQKKVVEITKIQYNAGNVSELDMQQAKVQLYSTLSIIPNLKLSRQKSKNAIAVLLGVLPKKIEKILNDEKKDIELKSSSLKEIKESLNRYKYENESLIPTAKIDEDFKVSANLIKRRPDVKLAEYSAMAKSASIGMAEADLYPHFSLFGSIGYNNVSGDYKLDSGDAIGVSFGPSLSWNIFQYGRIKNQIRAYDAAFQEALIKYNNTILKAVSDVKDALESHKYNKKRFEFTKLSVTATVKALNISLAQYNDGLVSYQRLLTSVKNLTLNEDKFALVQGDMALDIVRLYKALGGGWQVAHEKPYLNNKDLEQMRKRVDWGRGYLEKSSLKEVVKDE